MQIVANGDLPAPLQRSHQQRASDPGASVWVEASAGTGKTRVLTDRVLRLLLDGNEPARILCLTFTNAAAAEMANRVNERLSHWTVLDRTDLAADIKLLTGIDPSAESIERARRLFANVLDAPGGLRIQTIHAFCQSLLARFPIEAGVSPHFSVMEERSAIELFSAAQEKVF
ncbi:MAG: UvrD-helicase domain-containing protein, partial [Proteobacteria bacterium]|nr:UvrD-helicase domain-containing protein [Pseudomonadota bacterium]